jgi:hypothetical protein
MPCLCIFLEVRNWKLGARDLEQTKSSEPPSHADVNPLLRSKNTFSAASFGPTIAEEKFTSF